MVGVVLCAGLPSLTAPHKVICKDHQGCVSWTAFFQASTHCVMCKRQWDLDRAGMCEMQRGLVEVGSASLL